MWKLNLRFKRLVLRCLHHNDIQKLLTNPKSSQEIISKTRRNDSTRSCVAFVVFLEGWIFFQKQNTNCSVVCGYGIKPKNEIHSHLRTIFSSS